MNNTGTYATHSGIFLLFSFLLYPMFVVINANVMEEDLVVWADIIGTIAGILVLSSFIPQIIKAYKTKKMFDVSAHLMILIASGMFLWVIYGFIRSDPVIIGSNVTGFALNITLLIMKVRYDRFRITV